MLNELKKELREKSDKEKAKILQRFFKTGKGEYGEGDIFLGINVPVQREISRKYDLNLEDIQELLNSEIHEERLVGLINLIRKYEKDSYERGEIIDFYLYNLKKGRINNWDLVDLSCYKILGDFLINKEREILYKLSNSENLWEKRVSVVSCFAFIRKNDFKDILKISEILLGDKHDLIHKAVGWMLREVGKKDKKVLIDFLDKHYKEMPRTMLRYSIEKLEEDLRKDYLKNKR